MEQLPTSMPACNCPSAFSYLSLSLTHTYTNTHTIRVITRGIYADISDGDVCEVTFNTE
jgi:hypothetical protein